MAPIAPAGVPPTGRPAGDDGGRDWPAGTGLGHADGDALVIAQPHGVAHGYLGEVADLRPGDDRDFPAVGRPHLDHAVRLVDALDHGGRRHHRFALRGLRSRCGRLLGLLRSAARDHKQPGKRHDQAHRPGAFLLYYAVATRDRVPRDFQTQMLIAAVVVAGRCRSELDAEPDRSRDDAIVRAAAEGHVVGTLGIQRPDGEPGLRPGEGVVLDAFSIDVADVPANIGDYRATLSRKSKSAALRPPRPSSSMPKL